MNEKRPPPLPPKPAGFYSVQKPPSPTVGIDDEPTQPSIPSVKAVPAEKPPAWAASLADEMRAMRVNADGNHRVVMHAIDGLTGRVVVLEKHKADLEGRKYSGEIKRVSDGHLDNSAAIGLIKADVSDLKQNLKVNTAETVALRAALAANTNATMAIKAVLIDDVKGFLKENPQLVRAAVTFLATVFGTLTTYFAARGH